MSHDPLKVYPAYPSYDEYVLPPPRSSSPHGVTVAERLILIEHTIEGKRQRMAAIDSRITALSSDMSSRFAEARQIEQRELDSIRAELKELRTLIEEEGRTRQRTMFKIMWAILTALSGVLLSAVAKLILK